MKFKKSLFSSLAVALVVTTTAMAAEVQFDKMGMRIEVPTGWQTKLVEEPGRTFVLLKRPVAPAEVAALSCQVNRYDMPQSMGRYTQAQLNDAYERKPMSRGDWLTRFQELGGFSVSEIDFGKSSLGGDVAYWSVATLTDEKAPQGYQMMVKTLLSQTPRYGWNVQCSVMSPDRAKVKGVFRTNEILFDRIIGSFKHF